MLFRKPWFYFPSDIRYSLLFLMMLMAASCQGSGGGGPSTTTEIILTSENHIINTSLVDDYQCWSQRISLSTKTHVIRFETLLDNAQFVHHMVLFIDIGRDAPDGNFPCLTDMEDDWVFSYGWAPGMQDFDFPLEAGLPIEDGDQVVLQIHYFNPSAAEGTDNSSLKLVPSTGLRNNDAGVIALGNVDFELPPGQSDVLIEGFCDTNDPFPFLSMPQPLPSSVTTFGSMLHMHRLGSKIWTDVIRNNEVIDDDGAGVLGKNLNWNFDLQVLQPLDFIIQPGDVLRTSCVYDTTDQTEAVSFGLGTMDEMCFNFIYYYPAINIPAFPFCG